MFGENTNQEKKINITSCPNVITPNTIPEFVIPPKILPQQETNTIDWRTRFMAIDSSHSENEHQEKKTKMLNNAHIIPVKLVDNSFVSTCFSDKKSTNADPQSQAALSLPHLAKAQTCYGFCTLLESPHTRRKESLFHSSMPLLRTWSPSSIFSRQQLIPFSFNGIASKLSPTVMALRGQGTLNCDTPFFSDSSTYNSPQKIRPSPKPFRLEALSNKMLSKTIRKTVVYRNKYVSKDEGSSTGHSPNIIRRLSDGLTEPLPSPFRLAIFPKELGLHKQEVLKEFVVPVGKEGTLKISAEFSPDNQTLRVRLISAQGLYATSVDHKIISCSISVCLLPGKIQKQRSTTIKRSPNLIFNEDFFFDQIYEEEISIWTLRFKVVSRISTIKRRFILGDSEILLKSILFV